MLGKLALRQAGSDSKGSQLPADHVGQLDRFDSTCLSSLVEPLDAGSVFDRQREQLGGSLLPVLTGEVQRLLLEQAFQLLDSLGQGGCSFGFGRLELGRLIVHVGNLLQRMTPE